MHPNYSYFSRAATVSRKGHKLLAFGLETAQSFLKTHTMQKFQNMNRAIHHGASENVSAKTFQVRRGGGVPEK